MTLDPTLESNDPTAGESAGTANEQQSTPAPQAPAGRTYTDADMAAARRSFEAESRREYARREAQIRQEYEQRFAPKPVTNDPWSTLDPAAAQTLRAIFEHEWQTRNAPIQERQEDIALRNDELDMRSRHPDYDKVRVDVLEFAQEHGIADLETAYRAYKYEELSNFDKDAYAKTVISDYTKKARARANNTPAVEGRGGGAPSTSKKIKTWDEGDEAAAELFRASQE